ncbi:hypothetical protein [Streptomyces sp. NPDC047000]|uniref:hypothetical protein n=1 Tax=Streptomyces sp. NPDC047000 TaxID=3155474 RepID=UPI0033FABF67
MATRKPATPPLPPPAATPDECPVCKGSGEVARPVRVGRNRRTVGQQAGLCLNCLGSGEAPAP